MSKREIDITDTYYLIFNDMTHIYISKNNKFFFPCEFWFPEEMHFITKHGLLMKMKLIMNHKGIKKLNETV